MMKKVTKKQYRYECSSDGCTHIVIKGGVCIRHGANHKRCSSKECTNRVIKGGVCLRHGAKRGSYAVVKDAQYSQKMQQ
eukprot:scaffold20276_cov224-Skeletonema_marinoi.AAC.1